MILVSAYAENARNICAVKYADFLVEPINADDLQLVLIRALQNVIKAQPAYITLSYDNAVTVLNTNEIKYCESNGRKLIFHTLSGTYTAYIKISEATDKLPPNFVRLHKSFVVNFDYIAAIYPQAFVTEPKFRFLKKSIRPLRKCLFHMPMPGELFSRRCKKFCTYFFFLFAKSFFCGILLLFPRGREGHRFRLV